MEADAPYEMGRFCMECLWSLRHNVGLAASSHCFSGFLPCNESRTDGRVRGERELEDVSSGTLKAACSAEILSQRRRKAEM